MTEKTVADIMTREVITLREEDNLSSIESGMDLLGLRHLPVVDDGRLVGLVTHRDILRYTLARFEHDSVHPSINAAQQASTFVASIMTRDVEHVRPDTPLWAAAIILAGHRFGCLPVTEEDGTLVGIVTENDMVRALAALALRDSCLNAA